METKEWFDFVDGKRDPEVDFSETYPKFDKVNGEVTDKESVSTFKVLTKNLKALMEELEDVPEEDRMQAKDEKLTAFSKEWKTGFSERNLDAMLRLNGRLVRMKAIINHFNPDILTVQELDFFENFASELEKLGYTSDFKSSSDESAFKPLSERKRGSYIEMLTRTSIAHAPKQSSNGPNIRILKLLKEYKNKMKASSVDIPDKNDKETSLANLEKLFEELEAEDPEKRINRKELIKQIRMEPKGEDDKKDKIYDAIKDVMRTHKIYDDGPAIFWKKNRFSPTSSNSQSVFEVLDEENGVAIIKVELYDKLLKKTVTVVTTHLASGEGPKNSAKREKQVKKILDFIGESKDVIVALDANCPPGETETHSEGFFKKLWNPYIENLRKGYPVKTASTNKCRGPASNQPKKIGIHALAMIDYIYTNIPHVKYTDVFKLPKFNQVKEDKVESTFEPDVLLDKDYGILPSLSIPSDHWPLVVDLEMCNRAADI
eukprot:CAMPEP_0167764252 /NCGR_PEP_ID=MMETSP0110_2-20121227/13908_1 /TAXON_ID=629695 /ORGANISM="Gymnochlora sp., Strain CCMP2014" /LENGTH=487 /DNA_ID=CAMNT_0007651593 /DNA_START=340 /DNA_END=1803 /DNA_ORIENTATION=+